MPSTTQQFEVRQERLSGGYLPFVFFILMFVGLQLFKDNPGLKNIWCVGFMVASVLTAIIQWRRSRCLLLAEPDRLIIEVVKKGYGMPLGMSVFLWSDLTAFSYDGGGTDSSESLTLKWRNHSPTSFSGKDMKAFLEYLRAFFPKKEKSTFGIELF